MNKFGIALCVLVAAIALTAAKVQSCSTCNCQFDNIQVLDQLVEAKVKNTLANEPRKFTIIYFYNATVTVNNYVVLLQFCNYYI
jgi:hypothetical protein